MAYSDAPHGFQAIGSLGGQYSGALLECAVLGGIGTDVGIGDFVKLAGSATVAGTNGSLVDGIPSVIAATAGTSDAPILGLVASFAHDPTDLSTQFFDGSATSNDRIVYVVPATSDVLFVGQEDGAGAVLTADEVGNTTDIIATVTTDGTYGRSRQEIDSNGTASASASAQVQILRMDQDPVNTIGSGTTAGTRWVVRVTETQLSASAVTIGV